MSVSLTKIITSKLLIITACMFMCTTGPLYADDPVTVKKEMKELLEWLQGLRDKDGKLGGGLIKEQYIDIQYGTSAATSTERDFARNTQDFSDWTISKLYSTRTLDLNGLVIEDFGKLEKLKHLKQLRTLALSCNDLSGNLSFLKGLPDLSSLIMVSCGVTDKDLEELLCLKNLRDINVAGCPVSDEGVRVLAKIHTLRSIQIGSIDKEDPHPGGVKLTAASIETFTGMQSLKYLNLSYLNDGGALAMASSIRNKKPCILVRPGIMHTTQISGVVTRYGYSEEKNLWHIGRWPVFVRQNETLSARMRELEFAYVTATGKFWWSAVFPDNIMNYPMLAIQTLKDIRYPAEKTDDIRLEPSGTEIKQSVDIFAINRSMDTAFLVNGDKMHGTLIGVTDKQIAWRYMKNTHQVLFDKKDFVMIEPAVENDSASNIKSDLMVHLTGGDKLPCVSLKLKDNLVTVSLEDGRELEINKHLVDRISNRSILAPESQKAVKPSGDTIVMADKSMSGEVASIENGKVHAIINGQMVELPLFTVVYVAFKGTAKQCDRSGINVVLTFRSDSDSSVAIEMDSIKDGVVSGKSPSLGKVSFKLTSLSRISFQDY